MNHNYRFGRLHEPDYPPGPTLGTVAAYALGALAWAAFFYLAAFAFAVLQGPPTGAP